MSVVAIIPARGGSKGIPRKNLADLHGDPLLAYSIKAAQRARLVDHIVVSTDDEEIAELSRSLGCMVPGLRPQQISGDTSTINEAMNHALTELGKMGVSPKVVIVLYPTSPFRSDGLIDCLVQKLLDGHSPVYAVKPEGYPEDGCYINTDGKLEPIAHRIDRGEGDQDLSYVSRSGLFYGHLRHHVAYSAPYVHVVDDPIAHVDIDAPEDLLLAKQIVARGMYALEEVLP